MAKLRFKNIADSVVSLLSNAATVAREWDFPDKDGTVAMLDDVATVQTDIDTHEADTANPHNVTKTQVGLGNVPNLSFSGTNTGDQDLSSYATTTALNAKVTDAIVDGVGTVAPSQNVVYDQLVTKSLSWFNVTKYGLVGDGTTNNDTAIDALITLAPEGSVIYFPGGTYVFATQHTIAKSISLLGDGPWKSIITTTQNVNVFLYTTGVSLTGIYNVSIEKLRLQNTATTPSSGAAIRAEVCGSLHIHDCYITGFYNNVYLNNCFQSTVSTTYFGAYLSTGLVISNDGIFIDIGDNAVINSQFIPAVRNATYSIFQQNAGGTRLLGNKFNWNGTFKAGTHYYYDGAGATVDLMIHGNSFENFSTSSIRIGKTSGSFRSITITGNQIALGSTTSTYIVLNGVNNAAIMGNTLYGNGASSFAIGLTNATNVTMLNEMANFSTTPITRSGTTTATYDYNQNPVIDAVTPNLSIATSGTSRALIGVASSSDNGVTGTVANDLYIRSNQKVILSADGGTTLHMSVDVNGSFALYKTVTAAGTTGARTINKPSGVVNFAAGASTLVVTNSLVTTSSMVIVQVLGVDTTAKYAVVTRASGSFTITLNAVAVAELSVCFFVIN